MNNLIDSELKLIFNKKLKIVIDLNNQRQEHDRRLTEIEEEIYLLKCEEDNTLAVMDELEAQIEKEEESLKLFQTEIDRRQELGLVLQSQSELEQAGQMQLFL